MKQLMHRILLTIILVTGCMYAYPSIIIGDLYYELEESAGTATVIGLYNQDVAELTIPDTVTFSDKTFAVTKIAESAFGGKRLPAIDEREFIVCSFLRYLRLCPCTSSGWC